METIVVVLLGIGIVAGVVRALRPSDLADRVIALDLSLLGLVGLLAVAAVTGERTWLLDALPLIGLLAVVATVAFALAVERRR